MKKETLRCNIPAATSPSTPGDVSPSLAEEIANSVTHGLGLILSFAGLVILIQIAMQAGLLHIVGSTVFGISLVLMYAASTLYHSFRTPRIKRILRIIDHIAIYYLIAGSYTPFLMLLFDGKWRWGLLLVVWGLALAGTIFKLFFTGRFERASTLLYVGMGWMVVAFGRPLLDAIPSGGLVLLLAGGLLYTGGVIFFMWERLPFNHAIWHLFVLGGSCCHYFAVTLYLL